MAKRSEERRAGATPGICRVVGEVEVNFGIVCRRGFSVALDGLTRLGAGRFISN